MAAINGSMPPEVLVTAMSYLVGITDNDETEIFKLCLEFWLVFSNQLHASERSFINNNPAVTLLTFTYSCVLLRTLL
jgi:Chromosome region maintenance or exportin repeat